MKANIRWGDLEAYRNCHADRSVDVNEEDISPAAHRCLTNHWLTGSYNQPVKISALLILACSSSVLSLGAAPRGASLLTADKIIVKKSDRTLSLVRQDKIIKTFKISLGGDPIGPKARQGDHKTPEGTYLLDRRNLHSKFYRSIHISYPNAHHRLRAKAQGVAAGGDIFLHGLPNGYGWVGSGHRLKDWTDGCIAVTNQEMDEI